jgi:hypothetical protein
MTICTCLFFFHLKAVMDLYSFVYRMLAKAYHFANRYFTIIPSLTQSCVMPSKGKKMQLASNLLNE